MKSSSTRPETLRRRAVQPVWTALDRRVLPFVERGVLLAISGGRDSSVLLEACAAWRHRHRGPLEVASVDHGHRSGAPAEVEAVAARAMALGFTAHTLRATPARADEASLRAGRYGALWSCARDRGLSAIATAHHADDDAEGLLLDLLGKGGGAEGAAMAPATRVADGWLLRPLLDLHRASLTRALSALDAPAAFNDPEDARGGNVRARARAEVWPHLLAMEPRARARLALKARRRAEDEDALRRLGAAVLVRDGEDLLLPLQGVALAVARRALHEAQRQLAPERDPRSAGRTLDALLAAAGLLPPSRPQAGKSFHLPGVTVTVEAAALRIRRTDRTVLPARDDPES